MLFVEFLKSENIFYIIPFGLAFLLSIVFTLAIKKIAWRFNILDKPDKGKEGERKIHSKSTPLLGGSAIFISFFTILFIFSNRFLSSNLNIYHLLGFFAGALFLIIGGFLDDRYNLSPLKQFIFPILAIVSIILGGVEIEKVSNPMGGIININIIPFISEIIIFAWLLGMMYTTKLLDGVDGLVSGVGLIASFIIFLFTLSTTYFQPDISLAAIIFSGAILGFLVFNWHPAKIFLGEGGSLLIGYILGVLSIISGAKIAIALLVMGIPILDVMWTIIRRIINKKNPFKFSDRQHLHHRLLDAGLSQPKTVLVFVSLSFIFGFSGLFLQTRGKFLALFVLTILMFLTILFFYYLGNRRNKNNLKTLLFHICCAPCSSYVTKEILKPKYNITWYFYNSNLSSQEEYEKRLNEVKKMAKEFNIPLIVEPYLHEKWLEKVKGLEKEPETGKRCKVCYFDRLDKAFKLASLKNFDYVGTSLLVSTYKDGESINNINRMLSKKYNIKVLEDNIRSNEIFRKSQEYAKELGVYRQKFCGCEFSIYKKKKKKNQENKK
ncbi:MAG: epoxyqueuosine reductase QueH [Patescibacteria group bacterium]|jgi:UDP-GlcNAc:undecaprenyl-phosphate GlcNAc-1-phosphate transferase|nr:epoxyqueuosine reductase QueH [Patescibacteria group bacterium]